MATECRNVWLLIRKGTPRPAPPAYGCAGSRFGGPSERSVPSSGLERLLDQAAANGEIENREDLREKALALQNLLIGLNVMAKVVRSEDDLWAAAKQTLKGLGLYRS